MTRTQQREEITRERRKARWENGVLKLDKPLDLPEGTEVTVVVVPSFMDARGRVCSTGASK
ncbi:MAG: antitoxin family protein [Armatimonadota bacterium]